MKVAVIGAGAAGMTAAAMIAASGIDVDVFEKNDRIGRKLFITGKGRCNLTNMCSPAQIIENIVNNPKFMLSAINSFTSQDTVAYFESLGLKTKVERGRRVYPLSDKSSDVISALHKAMSEAGVKLHLSSPVRSLVCSNGKITGLITDQTHYSADCVIVATGGKSYPLTGSTGDGYSFAQACGHNIITPRAALVPILLHENVTPLAGLSLKNVAASVFKGDKEIASLFGEMLFTHTGVSGPIILSLSSYINKIDDFKAVNNTYNLVIDLKPALSYDKLDKRVLSDLASGGTKQIKNVLHTLMPKALIPYVLMQSGINEYTRVCDIEAVRRNLLVSAVKGLKFTVSGIGSIEEGIITAGGVDVRQINPKNCASKITEGLYFIGEVLDVDALTGGYNLQIAFSTAAACARDVILKNN